MTDKELKEACRTRREREMEAVAKAVGKFCETGPGFYINLCWVVGGTGYFIYRFFCWLGN